METQTQATQSAMTPAKALARLKAGNTRFVTNCPVTRSLIHQTHETHDGQYPFAVVLGCIDSRVAPELVFDQGIGDIFSVRVAGNFVNADILGSLEYGCKVAGAKLIVVLGHSRCGAIKGACDQVQLGNLTDLLSKLKPAIDAVVTPPGAVRNAQNATFVQQVAEKNVALTINAIKQQSAVLSAMLAQGEIGIVGAMYDITTGKVTFD